MKRKRWKARLVGGLLVLTGLAGSHGCKNQLLMEPAEYDRAASHLPAAKLETQPHEAILPPAVQPGTAPATIFDPSRPPRPLTRMEAIAIALERGNQGSQGLNGTGNDNLPQSDAIRGGSSGTDSIRAFALSPASAAIDIERSLSKFDARWLNSITWNKVDQPTLTLQQSFSNGDRATLTSALVKPLPTGGMAGITFSTDYLNLATPPSNPQFVALTTSYTPRLAFSFEQPLLQGFGVEVNQLRSFHPGSISGVLPNLRFGSPNVEGILTTRIRSVQSKAQFDVIINATLLNVETAYWNLYSAYYNLAAQEEGLKYASDSYLYLKERGGRVIRDQQVFQAEAQYYRFKNQVLNARQQVLTAERALRDILGMPTNDGSRLIPTDEPTLTPYMPNYDVAANEALNLRPELQIARQELKAAQLDLMTKFDARRPDLRMFASYDVAGLGARLDGDTTTVNALRSLSSNQFNSWTIGLRFEMPLGFRNENAEVRKSRLNIQQQFLHVVESERRALSFLTERIRDVEATHARILLLRAERMALQQSVKLDQDVRRQGAVGTTPEAAVAFISNLLQQQQQLASATAAEYQAIADYNSAIARLEWAKGTLQTYNNVSVAEGPLPPYVQKKAEDHFRATDAALKLREHPADLPLGPLHEMRPLGDTALPPLPGTPVAPAPAPWMPTAPTPKPLPDLPPQAAPMTPPKTATNPSMVPHTMTGARPQLVPADAPAPVFTSQGTVSFPTRRTSTPVSVPEPVSPPSDPTGTGR